MLRFRDIGLTAKVSMVVLIPYGIGIVLAGVSGYNAYVNSRLLQESRLKVQAIELAAETEKLGFALPYGLQEYARTGERDVLKRLNREISSIGLNAASLKRALPKESHGVQALSDAEKALRNWARHALEPGIGKVEKGPAGARMEALATEQDASNDLQKLRKSSSEIVQVQRAAYNELMDRALWNEKVIYNLLLYGMMVIAVTALVLVYVVARRIVGPIQQAVALAEATSNGDLTQTLGAEGGDEIGVLVRSLNGMVESLKRQNRELMEGMDLLATAGREVSTIVSQLNESTTKTSTAVGEATVTVDQVKQSAQTVRGNAKSVAESSQRALEISDSGRRATVETTRKIDLIKDQVGSIGETVVRLSEHSQAIEEIIAAVQDLAEQSNILSVNASIEAARAGDQGKGFSVVANEIKTLADKSREATEQIRTILDDTRKRISAVVMATDQAGKAVDAGVAQSTLAGESIESLADSVGISAQAASVIDASIDQQAAGTEQVAEAMVNIEQAMHGNVASSTKLEGTVSQLTGLGDQLKDMVSRYKV